MLDAARSIKEMGDRADELCRRADDLESKKKAAVAAAAAAEPVPPLAAVS